MINKERKGHFFHVTHNKVDDKWHVKEVKGKEEDMKIFDSIEKAEDLAKKVKLGHVVIHDERGRFEVVENF